MNKKKIIYSITAFILTFIISIIIFFPVSDVVSNIIQSEIEKRKLDVKYDSLNIGFFSTNIKNFKTGKLVINNIKAEYNPIGLLFKRISFQADSPAFILNGKISGSSINANIKLSIAGISELINSTGSGSLNGVLVYDTKTSDGRINLSSGEINFTNPIINITANSIKGKANIKGTTITIEQLEAEGANGLNVTGSININKEKIDNSILNIAGNASMGSYKMNFVITGQARSPQFSIQ